MGWTGSTDPLAPVRLAFASREAAVTYAERQGLEYEVRESSAPKKVHVAAEKPLRQPMSPWPIPLRHSELERFPVPEIGATPTSAELAA